MKGQKKKQNGITLIALVISIIVMLILAGVSINALMGDNGILRQAQYASFLSEMAAVEEAVQLWGADHYDDANHSIPANGLVSETEITSSERLSGEVGYYRTWSTTKLMPQPTDVILSTNKGFNDTFSGELVYFPGGVEDLYYLDNDGLNLNSNKKYLIDAVNSMVYSAQGISLNGVRCYSLEMAKAVMNGTYDAPTFAAAEVSASQSAGGIKAAGNTEPQYIDDGNGNLIENPNYNPYGFQIISSVTSNNIYKLYNNGKLYGKGLKGIGLQTDDTEMDKIDSTVFQELTIPDEIPSCKKVIPGNNTIYVIDNNNDLWAWGENQSNKLGLSETQQIAYIKREPVKLNVGGIIDSNDHVTGSKPVYNVFDTGSSLFVVTTGNELYAAGCNNNNAGGGFLGLGHTDEVSKLTLVDNFSDPKNIICMTGRRSRRNVYLV